MKQVVIVLSIAFFALSATAQVPVGVPTQKINGWIQNNYTVPDSGTVITKRDTSWRPRFTGTSVTWQRPGIDTVPWFWNGAKWGKIGSGATTLTWQQTLTTGSTLTTDNSVNIGAHTLRFNQVNDFGLYYKDINSNGLMQETGVNVDNDSIGFIMSLEDAAVQMFAEGGVTRVRSQVESAIDRAAMSSKNVLNNTQTIISADTNNATLYARKIRGSAFGANYLKVNIDSVVFAHDSSNISNNGYLRMYIKNLPSSSSVTDSAVVKNSNGILAYRASSSSGTVTSVGLSMPSAFNVTGSPITGAGTIGVTGAGTTLQYIRGNGTLATFDTTAIPNFYVKVKSLITPPGSNTQIVYNNSGAFGASPFFTFNNVTRSITIADDLGFTSVLGAGSIDILTSDDAATPAISIVNDASSTLLMSLGGSSTAAPYGQLSATSSDLHIQSSDRVVLTADSIMTKGIIRASADSIWGIGSYVSSINANTMIKVPVTGLSIPLEQVLTAGSNITTNHTTAIGTNKWIISGGDAGDYLFGITTSTALGKALKVDATTGTAIDVDATSGSAIDAASTTGSAITAGSESGSALFATTTGGGTTIRGVSVDASVFSFTQTNTTSTTDITNIGSLQKTAFLVTPAAGYGAAFDYFLSSATNSSRQAGRLSYKWTTATDASRTSMFELSTVNSGTLARKFAISGAGQGTLDSYIGTTFQTVDTSFNALVVDASGNIFKRAGDNGGGGSLFANNANIDTVLRIGNATNRSMRIKESTNTRTILRSYGTSIENNVGAPSANFGYTTLFSDLYGLTLRNGGINGQKLQIDFNPATIPQKGDSIYAVILGHWANDPAQENGTTLTYIGFVTKYNHVLDTMINSLGYLPGDIYCMSINWFNNSKIPQYNKGIDSLCTIWGTTFVNDYARLLPRGNGGLANDGLAIHPDSIGHSIAFKTLAGRFTYSNFYRNQSLLVNGVTELDTLVLRRLKNCTKGDLLLALDSVGNVRVMNDSFFIWNMTSTGNTTYELHKQIANINLQGTADATILQADNHLFLNGATSTFIPNTGMGLYALATSNSVYLNGYNYTGSSPLKMVLQGLNGSGSGQLIVGDYSGIANTTDKLILRGSFAGAGNFLTGDVLGATYGKVMNMGLTGNTTGEPQIYSYDFGGGGWQHIWIKSGITIDHGSSLSGAQPNGIYNVNDSYLKDSVMMGTVRNGTSADSVLVRNTTTKAVRMVAQSSISGTWQQALTTGSTLSGNNTITGANTNFTWNDMNTFTINSDLNVLAKADGTIPYSSIIAGSGNVYEFGYTPVAGTFSKGAGIFIDTNNNVGLAVSIPTAAPLYATGNSAYVQGLQSNGGNFFRVDNVTTDITAGLSQYWFNVDATGGNITITLPAASTSFGSGMGIKYYFRRVDNSGNTITVSRAGSDTINGATSFTIAAQYQVNGLQCISTSTWASF